MFQKMQTVIAITPKNILTILKEISVYRKLGIGIADIKKILETRDFSLLEQIYEEKSKNLSEETKRT